MPRDLLGPLLDDLSQHWGPSPRSDLALQLELSPSLWAKMGERHLLLALCLPHFLLRGILSRRMTSWHQVLHLDVLVLGVSSVGLLEGVLKLTKLSLDIDPTALAEARRDALVNLGGSLAHLLGGLVFP